MSNWDDFPPQLQADILDTSTREGLKAMNVLTAERIGYHVKGGVPLPPKDGLHVWIGYACYDPSDDHQCGAVSVNPVTAMENGAPNFCQEITFAMRLCLKSGVHFSLGTGEFEYYADPTIVRDNAFYCHMTWKGFVVVCHAPTLPIAITHCFNDLWELCQGDLPGIVSKELY